MRTKPPILLAIIVIIGAMSFLIYSGLRNTGVPYFPVSNFPAVQMADSRVRLSGNVAYGSIQKQPDLTLQFRLQHEDTGLPVLYQGVTPDTFREGGEVVLEGKYDADERLFRADLLMAKCPSKYEPKEETGQSESPAEPRSD